MSPFLVETLSNSMPHRTTGSTGPSMGSVFSRGLAFHTVVPSNRDQNRNLRIGTVTETVMINLLSAKPCRRIAMLIERHATRPRN